MDSAEARGDMRTTSIVTGYAAAALCVGACGGNAIVDPAGGDPSGAPTGGAPSTPIGGTSSSGGQGNTGNLGGDGVGGLPPPDNCGPELIGTSCDDTFFDCPTETIDGIPCCMISKVCENGIVEWPVACFDNCPQNCELVGNSVHCTLMPWCDWVEDAGCFTLDG